MTVEFQPWPKIARLNREITITEKIDGTNAAVVIRFVPPYEYPGANAVAVVQAAEGFAAVYAQSRTRFITPQQDNYGFAQWVAENAEMLVQVLGEGTHFGEWWGSGIQRGYGLPKGEKRFSLFNTARWGHLDGGTSPVVGLGVVFEIYKGPFSEHEIHKSLNELASGGSFSAPGFMRPEGIVIWHDAARQSFKVTLEGDAAPKGLGG